jgi:hypothetical protein
MLLIIELNIISTLNFSTAKCDSTTLSPATSTIWMRKAFSWASSVAPSASFPSNYGSVRRLTRRFKIALANRLLS